MRSPEHTARLRALAQLQPAVVYVPSPKAVTARDKANEIARHARAAALTQAGALTRR